MRHRTWIDIDDRALTANVHTLQKLLSPGCRFSAVVKANAYGHGLKTVVPILAKAGVDAFCVDSVDEGLDVRSIAPGALILLTSMVPEDRLDEALAANMDLTAFAPHALRLIDTAASAQGIIARVHLKADTGMHRQGIMPSEWAESIAFARSRPHLAVVGVSTHFASMDEPGDTDFAVEQHTRFREAVAAVRTAGLNPDLIHAANSAATILYPDTHGTMVRCGAALYGIWPSEAVEAMIRKLALRLELVPALTWKTRVSQIKSVPPGSHVGYDLTETLGKSTRLAVLPVGYYDGYDRRFSSVGDIILHGTKCRVVGRVSMNMTVVDVSALPNVKPGDEAVLIGRTGRHSMSFAEAAAKIHTIPYELVTRLGAHIPRGIVSG